MSYLIFSPDNLPISPDDFATLQEAKDALAAFVRQYTPQGFYLTAEHDRIPLDKLERRCSIQPGAPLEWTPLWDLLKADYHAFRCTVLALAKGGMLSP